MENPNIKNILGNTAIKKFSQNRFLFEARCQKTWEKLVHYLVGSEIHGPASKLLKKLIENVGLM